MDKEFNYYVLEPIITSRTAFLVNDGNIDDDAGDFLLKNEIVKDPSTVYLCEAFDIRKPDFSVDYFDLDGFAVFSQKVCDAIIKNKISINDLQLIKAIITEGDDEYDGFSIAYVHRALRTFDEESSKVKTRNDTDGRWITVEKIVLDKNLLSQIPLKDRLTYESIELPSLKLYHESIVDIIKSVNPTGVRFTPIEEWKQ